MLVNLDFRLKGWIKGFILEASSEQEAVDKLMSMTLQEIIENDSISADAEVDISDVDTTVLETTVTAEVSEIQYDLSQENMDQAVIDYLLAKLPTSMTVTVEGVKVTDDEYAAIRNELSDKTMQDIRDFKYKVINRT